MAIEVFNRYENKYLVKSDVKAALEQKMATYMEEDAHCKEHGIYTIRNIYYDTPDSHLIRTSLAKPRYKEKLRLRAYGLPGESERSFVEIKKKYRGLVNKRRSALPLSAAEAFLATGIVPVGIEGANEQVLREVSYLLERQPLQPAMYLSYRRCAWFGKGQHDLRISFDRDVFTRRDRLSLIEKDDGDLLLPEGTWIMEVKVHRSIPVWFSRLLAEYDVRPVSFSKYGTAYKKYLTAEQAPVKSVTISPSAQKKMRGILVPA